MSNCPCPEQCRVILAQETKIEQLRAIIRDWEKRCQEIRARAGLDAKAPQDPP